MQKKIFAWAMSMAVAAMITCTGCAQNTNSSGTDSGSSTAQTTTLDDNDTAEAAVGQSLSAIQSGEAGVTTDEDDLCDNYDAFDAEITLEDDSTKVKGNTKAVSVKDNCITISAGGTYRLSGKLTKGQVLVTGSEKVKLYLDGVEITSPSGPALVCTNEKRTILSLAKGSQNILTDSADNADTEINGCNVSACALFAQDKLTINGSGSLTVTGSSVDGIVCKDDLKLVNGTITVEAAQDGVKGKDCVAMFGADLNVTAGNDGIKSTESNDDTKGFLQLEQGSATVQAGGDCLQAETLVWIADGTYHLTSSGTAVNTETGEVNSSKGIHCGGDVEIAGGKLTIDAAEDGVNCTGSLELQAGEVDVTSAEDGIQADGDLTVSGGAVTITTTGTVAASAQDDFQPNNFGGGNFGGNGNIPPDNADNRQNAAASDASAIPAAAMQSTADSSTDAGASAAAAMTTAAEDATSKGIKCGGNLTMSGGSCTIDSTDHAVHAAGTAVFSGTTLEITSDNKGISSHGDLEISGGDITIHSCTEGVESKAEMTISGGNVRILDASDDGLNTGGSDSGSYAMTITGGTLLALSSKGMMEYPESGCLIATNCNAAAGEQISIVDKNGTVLATLQSPKAVSDVIYGIGDSDSADYTIVTGGTYDGTLNEDGYGEGGSVSGGTEVTANGGTGSMNGGAPAGGGQGGTPPEMPNLNNSGGNTAS
ncbi:carbohydrate-binding domain-containing protein [Ruminococcus callidus]|uniref:carbohydrate-binding domain-containing protein n=1 Tax=Ruminococcus callidus TaxID=40519 RepID=UPI00352156A5